MRDPLTGTIVDAAIEVRRQLGPGLLESAYQHGLAHELALRSVAFRTEVPRPIVDKETDIECGCRMDLVVEGRVRIEVKSMEAIAPIHEAQILTYLRLSGLSTGLLIDFNVSVAEDGDPAVRPLISPQRAQGTQRGFRSHRIFCRRRVLLRSSISGFPLLCSLW